MLMNIAMKASMFGMSKTVETAVDAVVRDQALQKLCAICNLVLLVSAVVIFTVGSILLVNYLKGKKKEYHVNEDGSIDVDFKEVS